MSEVHTASARQPANVYTIHIYLRVFTHTHTASAKQPASVYMILASVYERQDMREQQKTASSCSNSWPKNHNKKGSERLLKPPAEIRSKKEHKIRTEIGKVSKALGIDGQGP